MPASSTTRGLIVLGPPGSEAATVARRHQDRLEHAGAVSADGPAPADRLSPPRLDRFNARLLRQLGGSELGAVSLETGWARTPDRAEQVDRARELFTAAYGDSDYVWEDSRNCLLLPLWREAIEPPPAITLVHRDREELVGALCSTRGLARATALAVWERYMRAALLALEGFRVEVVSAGEADSRADEPETSASVAQRELSAALDALVGSHERFDPPLLSPETEWTEPLLAERRRADVIHWQLNDQLKTVKRQMRAIGRGRAAAAKGGKATRIQAGLRRSVGRARRPAGSLPDFVIIGGQKCGTTALFRNLRQAPGTELPSKELHFFDEGFDRGLDWYRGNFPSPARAPWRQRPLTGEASPYYMFHPLAAQRAWEAVPHARLIALVRNPVTRAASHYYHEVRNGNEQLQFEEALAREEERVAGEAERLATDPDYSSFAHRHYSYQGRGLYADQLDAWLERFPRDQLLVLPSERLMERPDEALASIHDFLGLSGERPELAPFNQRDYPDIPPATEARLAARFEEPNARLYALLGEDFGW